MPNFDNNRDGLDFFRGLCNLFLLTGIISLFVMLFFHGIVGEQEIREYKQAHLAEYRQWWCLTMEGDRHE